MGELDGKVAIVTGAGRLRSIGYEASIALARLGAHTVLTGTGRDPSTFQLMSKRSAGKMSKAPPSKLKNGSPSSPTDC